jgi:hypothetical protein
VEEELIGMQNEENYIYYFAFGSNLEPGVFITRRMMNPVEVIRGVLPKWQLIFDYAGLPGIEPCFGNIKANELAEVHGIIYKITMTEFDYLLSTEGSSYNTVAVDIETYDGRVITAYSLVVPQSSNFILKTLDVPSKRYINLIRSGAKHHQLHPKYIEYLQTLPSIKPSKLKIAFVCIEAVLICVLGSPIWLSSILYQLFVLPKQTSLSPMNEAKSIFVRFITEGLRSLHLFFHYISPLSSTLPPVPYYSPPFPLNSIDYKEYYHQSSTK